MYKDQISQRNAMFILIAAVSTNIIVLGLPSNVKQDTWISLLFSTLTIIPIVIIYARICVLMPGMNVFDMNEALFGKVLSVIINVYFIIHFIAMASSVIKNFAEFFRIISFGRTPFIVLILALTFVPLYLAKSGIEAIGKWTFIVVVFAIFIVFLVSSFAVPIMKLENVMPIMEHSVPQIMKDSVLLTLYPLGDVVLMFIIVGHLKKSANPYKVFIYGILLSIVFLLIIFFRSILILGPVLYESSLFPVFKSARVIQIGAFLQRIESLVSYNYVLGEFAKGALCLYGVTLGLAKIFKLKDNKKLVFPVGFLCAAISAILFNCVIEMFNFTNLFRYFAIVVQVILPVIMWITAEIKFGGRRKEKFLVVKRQILGNN